MYIKERDVCMNEIVMIDVAKLHSHPKNPRKNVGDVAELAESIKKNGIMQNLTVVPFVSEVTGQKLQDFVKCRVLLRK